jgi:outer membrane protein OmpA-like peptidoglycan-associated protein
VLLPEDPPSGRLIRGVSSGGNPRQRALPPWVVTLLMLPVLAGCATPKPTAAPPKEHVFVLLPSSADKLGQITVSNPGGTQVLDQPYEATTVEAAAQGPRAPFSMAPADVQRVFGEALAAEPRAPAHFVLYFERDSERLTAASLALVAEILQAIRERQPAEVSVVGHTDSRGDRAYNYRLGLERAKRTAEALVSRGVDPNIVDVSSHGEDDPIFRTLGEVWEPRNRRVEVTVR